MVDLEAEERKEVKEFPISDENGVVVLMVKLSEKKSRIFIGDKEIMTCRFVPFDVPLISRSEYDEMESINDIIDHFPPLALGMGYDLGKDDEAEGNEVLEEWEELREELGEEALAELDYYVNCSNLQTWVENDYDTRILDYRLSFPLLKEMSKAGNQHARIKYAEEISKRFHFGNKGVKDYLMGECNRLSDEEKYSALDLHVQNLLHELKQYGDLSIATEKGTVVEMTFGSESRKDEILENPIPAEIFNKISFFRDLKQLTLECMVLTPAHVKEFGQLSQLTDLTTEKCVVGPLLRELGQIRSLESWYCTCLQDKEVPKELGCLEHLTSLKFWKCESVHLPKEIGNLEKLKVLFIDHSGSTSFPAEIGRLRNLEHLHVEECNLTSLPLALGSLKSLENLYIDNCHKLTELPATFGKLENLKRFVIKDSALASLPERIGGLRSLQTLEIKSCPLSELPESVGSLSKLETMHIENSPLEALPESFGNLQNLKELRITKCKLTGFPKSTEKLKKLVLLALNDNELTRFPLSVCDISSLKRLELASNQIKEIPEEVTHLRLLENLSISYNQLKKINPSVSKLKVLRYFSVKNNKIKKIPKVLASVQGMRLYVDDNPIEFIPKVIFEKEFLLDYRYKNGFYYEKTRGGYVPKKKRVVQSNGTIQFENQEYYVDSDLSGQTILVEKSEQGMFRSLRFYHDGKLVRSISF